MRPCGEPGAAKLSVMSGATKANMTRTCDMSKSEGEVKSRDGILRLFMLVKGLSNRLSCIPINLYTSLSLSLSLFDAPNLSDFIFERNAISKLIIIADV